MFSFWSSELTQEG